MANRILVDFQEEINKPDWILKVEPFVQKIMEKLNFDQEEISILFCNNKFIQELNKNYRNIDLPTDVLSFENGEKYSDEEGNWTCAGDIAISLETLPENAKYFEVDQNTELKRLLIHGILHLNGYDHQEEHIEKGVEPKCKMLVLQENLLLEFNQVKII